MKKNIHAFTLVELLVVIVIIGILAGIALPVFQKSQERARAISDQSNLRQLGIGIQAYKSDNNGDMPAGSAAKSPPTVWQQQLNPTYVTTWKVFKSPFDNRPNSEDKANAPVSYGFNGEGGTTGVLDADSSKFNYPSNLILVAPKMDAGAAPKFSGKSDADVIVKSDTAGPGDRGTHTNRKRINVLYADGHTEDLLYAKFIVKTGNDGLKRWIYDTP